MFGNLRVTGRGLMLGVPLPFLLLGEGMGD